MAFNISDKGKKEINSLIEHYPEKGSALMPILYIIQEEKGYISINDQLEVAKFLEIAPMQVRGVVEFYTMFRSEKCGKYLIQVCHTLSCSIMGAHTVVDVLRNKLKIDVGETTKDGKFTLLKVECLGSCGTAPVMQVNNDYYENLTEEKILRILDSLE
jgi:NADH-quinone oxidoreductase subunit E